MIDLQLFRNILALDSTTGKEGALAAYLETTLADPALYSGSPAPGACASDRAAGAHDRAAGASECAAAIPTVQGWDVPEGGRNLLFSWGVPRVVFCTHMDTVPPYIPPVFPEEMCNSERGRCQNRPKTLLPPEKSVGGASKSAENDGASVIYGRGACDAKGQIVALYAACRALADEGLSGFGLLLLSGEETGSWGAKDFAKTDFRAPYLIVGEPTEDKMVSACKGTKAFELTFHGEAFHSGYPQFGKSAVDAFVDFVNALRAVDFGADPELGPTTWNIGRLVSDNPQNVLSPELRCRLYFRTTFLSDGRVAEEVKRLAAEFGADVKEIGGDTPSRWFTIPGFEAAPASFGSDAPHLTNFEHRAICGPGSIRFAHRPDEQISIAELEAAAERYVAMFKALQ